MGAISPTNGLLVVRYRSVTGTSWPGQLNLMTAGNGVSHSEEPTGRYRGEVHGVQLWVAQPEATRHGAAAFEHHAELPRVELANGTGTVLIGEFAGSASTARADTEM